MERATSTAPPPTSVFDSRNTFDNAQGIMNRALHLVAIKVVRSTQDHRCSCTSLSSFDDDQLIVADTFLSHFGSFSDCAGFNEILQAQIVDTSSSENNINSSIEDFLDAFLGDVRFSLTDSVQLFWISDQHLFSHLHFGLL